MQIEQIPHISFQALTSCSHALRDPENQGCAWYATTDRRIAARIYLHANDEQFYFTILHFIRAGWEVTEHAHGFDSIDEAAAELINAIRMEADCGVTLKDVTPRLRYGKGRRSDRGCKGTK